MFQWVKQYPNIQSRVQGREAVSTANSNDNSEVKENWIIPVWRSSLSKDWGIAWLYIRPGSLLTIWLCLFAQSFTQLVSNPRCVQSRANDTPGIQRAFRRFCWPIWGSTSCNRSNNCKSSLFSLPCWCRSAVSEAYRLWVSTWGHSQGGNPSRTWHDRWLINNVVLGW